MRTPLKAALAAFAVVMFSAGCTSGGGGTETSAPGTTAPTGATTEEPSASGPAPSQVQEGGPTEILASEKFADWGGGYLFLAGITSGEQARSVRITLDGDGPLEWQTQYVDAAIQDGSGFEIDMGDSGGILQITMRGMRLPEVAEELITEADVAGFVVAVDPPFEGQSSVFIGLPKAERYRVEIFGQDSPEMVITFLGE